MTIAVVDYGIGNLGSVMKAFRHLGAPAILSGDIAELRRADVLVLPGDGAFASTMQEIESRGLVPVLREAVDQGRTLLGICIGMQLLFEGSDESPGVDGLGILPGRLRLLPDTVKRPQMQWNQLNFARADDPMVAGLGEHPWMYFVHSLHGVPTDPHDVVATCEYGGTLNVAFRRGTVFATQFHPEKSGPSGLALLANFVAAAAMVPAS